MRDHVTPLPAIILLGNNSSNNKNQDVTVSRLAERECLGSCNITVITHVITSDLDLMLATSALAGSHLHPLSSTSTPHFKASRNFGRLVHKLNKFPIS